MAKSKIEKSKVLFLTISGLLALGLAFSVGIYSGVKRNGLYQIILGIKNDVILVLNERQNLVSSGDPVHFLQPSRRDGSGVTKNKLPNDDSLIMMAGFFDGSNEVRLINRDGDPVARWPVRFSDYFPNPEHLVDPPTTDRNIDTHGALLNSDGSVVFNFDYGGTVKLSRCGAVEWVVEHPTHHSIETSTKGGYWVLGRRYLAEGGPIDFPPFMRQGVSESYEDDLIIMVSEDGKILSQKSIMEVVFENGLAPVLTATGYTFYPGARWTRELVHSNKVGELSAEFAQSFPRFEAGDLLLSLRLYNLLLVVDPDTWRVKWHQTGPWVRQHDPEFNADGTITVFNNNLYSNELGSEHSRPETPAASNIMRVDPETGETVVVYGGREGEELLSIIRGKHQSLAKGGFLITEFEGGRVLEVDANGDTVWEYINRYDKDRVLEITEARIYPASYFLVDDWSCREAKSD